MTYQPKTYRKQGGDEMVFADGGILKLESGSIVTDERFDGSIAAAGALLAIPTTARFVSKTTGGVEALTLANGVAGQKITISLVVDGGTGTLTPATKTGFVTIVFADAGDTANLEYVDDTVGWIINGLAGVAAPPVITI